MLRLGVEARLRQAVSEHRHHRHGRRRSRRGHRRRSFSPVRKAATGEVLHPKQSLVRDDNILALDDLLLDRSLREEGLTRKVAELLSVLINRVRITPPGSSNPSAVA